MLVSSFLFSLTRTLRRRIKVMVIDAGGALARRRHRVSSSRSALLVTCYLVLLSALFPVTPPSEISQSASSVGLKLTISSAVCSSSLHFFFGGANQGRVVVPTSSAQPFSPHPLLVTTSHCHSSSIASCLTGLPYVDFSSDNETAPSLQDIHGVKLLRPDPSTSIAKVSTPQIYFYPPQPSLLSPTEPCNITSTFLVWDLISPAYSVNTRLGRNLPNSASRVMFLSLLVLWVAARGWFGEGTISKVVSIPYTTNQSLEDWFLFVKILVVICLEIGQFSPMCYPQSRTYVLHDLFVVGSIVQEYGLARFASYIFVAPPSQYAVSSIDGSSQSQLRDFQIKTKKVLHFISYLWFLCPLSNGSPSRLLPFGLLLLFPLSRSISCFVMPNQSMEQKKMITIGDKVACLLDYIASSSCSSDSSVPFQTHLLGCINVVYDYSKLVGAFVSGIQMKNIQGLLHIEHASPTNTFIFWFNVLVLLFILPLRFTPVFIVLPSSMALVVIA